MGKNKAIRRLYCKICQTKFREREGSPLQYSKLPVCDVVQIIKCLGYGYSIEATADISEADPRTVERMLEKADLRAQDFHRLQLERLKHCTQAVELDELHGRVCAQPKRAKDSLARVARRAGRGFTSLWLCSLK